MFRTLTDTGKAAIFTALVLILAVAAALANSPLLVNSYLLGDSGIVITVGAALGAVLVSRMMPRGDNKARPDANPSGLEPVIPTRATSASRQV